MYPIFAIVFVIARNFGFEGRLDEVINNNMAGQEEIMNWLTNLVDNLLLNVKGGVIAGIGGVILFWSVIQVLNNIEASFNDIWQIRKAAESLAQIFRLPGHDHHQSLCHWSFGKYDGED